VANLRAKIKEFAEEFEVAEGLRSDLFQVLEGRPGSIDDDLRTLREGMQTAPNASVFLYSKLLDLQTEPGQAQQPVADTPQWEPPPAVCSAPSPANPSAAQLDPKVKELAEQYNLNESLTSNLNAVLEGRPETIEDDLRDLREALQTAPSPTALAFMKMRQMKESQTAPPPAVAAKSAEQVAAEPVELAAADGEWVAPEHAASEPTEPLHNTAPGLHPKVKELAEQFKLNEGLSLNLNSVLEGRPDTFEEDLRGLKEALATAPSPAALLFTKIREMKEGKAVGAALPDRDIEEVASRYRLDQMSTTKLYQTLAQLGDKRGTLDCLSKHLASSSDPSRAIIPMLERLKAGEDLGEPTVERSRFGGRGRSRSRGGRDRSRDNRRVQDRLRDRDRRDYRDRDRRPAYDGAAEMRRRREQDRRRSSSRGRRSRSRRSRSRWSRSRRSRSRRSRSLRRSRSRRSRSWRRSRSRRSRSSSQQEDQEEERRPRKLGGFDQQEAPDALAATQPPQPGAPSRPSWSTESAPSWQQQAIPWSQQGPAETSSAAPPGSGGFQPAHPQQEGSGPWGCGGDGAGTWGGPEPWGNGGNDWEAAAPLTPPQADEHPWGQRSSCEGAGGWPPGGRGGVAQPGAQQGPGLMGALGCTLRAW